MKDELIYKYLYKNFWVNENKKMIYFLTNEEAWTIISEIMAVFSIDYHEATYNINEWWLNYEKTNP